MQLNTINAEKNILKVSLGVSKVHTLLYLEMHGKGFYVNNRTRVPGNCTRLKQVRQWHTQLGYAMKLREWNAEGDGIEEDWQVSGYLDLYYKHC